MSDHQKIRRENVAKEQHSSRQYRLFATNCIVSRQMVDEKINEHLKGKDFALWTIRIHLKENKRDFPAAFVYLINV